MCLFKVDFNKYKSNSDTIEMKKEDGNLCLIINGSEISSVKLENGNYYDQSQIAKSLIDLQSILDRHSTPVFQGAENDFPL